MRLISCIVMTIVFSLCKASNKQDSNSFKSDLTYSEIINCVINSEQFDSIYIEKDLLFDTSNGLINVDFEIKKKGRNDNPHGFYLSIIPLYEIGGANIAPDSVLAKYYRDLLNDIRARETSDF